MKQLIGFVIILICVTSIIGCNSLLKTLVKEQQWSENYALAEGVEANDPAFIDGDLRTIGESQFPERNPRGGLVTGSDFPPSEAVVILPEKKNIYKIVIHTTNMQVFDVLARKQIGGWETIKTVKGNKEEVVNLRLTRVAITDGIKIRVNRTSDDASQRRKNVRRFEGWILIDGNIRSSGKIKEIELYGYVDEQTEAQPPAQVDSSEEIDLLLNE